MGVSKTAWKLGIRNRDLADMSLREFYACCEAHQEYNGGVDAKKKPKPMSLERLRVLGVKGA